MANFPTTQNAKGLKEFLGKIAKNGVPSKLTRDVVKSWGFTGANDGSFITIFAFIGFTDNAHVPTDRWRKARSDLPAALGDGISAGYSDLYATFPDAHDRDDQELNWYFRTHTDGNAVTVGRMVRTYRSLAELATFSEPDDGKEVANDAEVIAPAKAPLPPKISHTVSDGNAVTVNINIQLQLPSDASAETFDKFFASMKTHLMS